MPDNSRAGGVVVYYAKHCFTYEEWSYNDERAYLLCECGARTAVPIGPHYHKPDEPCSDSCPPLTEEDREAALREWNA